MSARDVLKNRACAAHDGGPICKGECGPCSDQADDVILALSRAGYGIVPLVPTDEMIIAMLAHYEMMSHDPPAPNVAHVRVVGTLAGAPALKERIRESLAASLRAVGE